VTGAERSLLSFLEVPVLVGDPQGRTVYVNPAFEVRFGRPAEAARGAQLAQLFEGGGREAVLGAVAAVIAEWRSVRFRLRERGLGFTAIASPILAGGENVGVVILLQEEVEGLERLFHVQRMLEAALEELAGTLEAAPPAPAALTGPLARAREWCRALRRELQGQRDLETA
jgi:transcriptional regulator of aromatic amino acid metabolism